MENKDIHIIGGWSWDDFSTEGISRKKLLYRKHVLKQHIGTKNQII